MIFLFCMMSVEVTQWHSVGGCSRIFENIQNHSSPVTSSHEHTQKWVSVKASAYLASPHSLSSQIFKYHSPGLERIL